MIARIMKLCKDFFLTNFELSQLHVHVLGLRKSEKSPWKT